MNSDRVVFGPRRPLKVLALALLAGPVAAGAAFLPEGSRASTSTPLKISNGTIAVIVAGMVLLACLLRVCHRLVAHPQDGDRNRWHDHPRGEPSAEG